MPFLSDYKVFISHSWKYDEDYRKVVSFLDSSPYFSYYNYSRPFDNPLECNHYTDTELTMLLTNQIKPTQVVLVIAGMYTAYSKWIQKEIDIACNYNKPIIGINKWGHERVPFAITSTAVEIVNWQASSIIQAIRNYA